MKRKGVEYHLCINYCNSFFMGAGRRHQGQLDPVIRRYRDDPSWWLGCSCLEYHHQEAAQGAFSVGIANPEESHMHSSKYTEEGRGLACKAAMTGFCKAKQGLGAYCTKGIFLYPLFVSLYAG